MNQSTARRLVVSTLGEPGGDLAAEAKATCWWMQRIGVGEEEEVLAIVGVEASP